jgi:hypothetical protein
MNKLSRVEKINADSYSRTEPKQFGNLHERMQFLMKCATAHGQQNIPNDMWHAIFDLQTEVKYYEPVNPPFGKRKVRVY